MARSRNIKHGHVIEMQRFGHRDYRYRLVGQGVLG